MVNFINWWGNTESELNPQNEWFKIFFKLCCADYIDANHENINLYTLFGPVENCINIDTTKVNLFFYGENLKNRNDQQKYTDVYKQMDALLGFFNDTQNSIRLPLWAIYHYYNTEGLFKPKINGSRNNQAIIVANHDINGKRREAIVKLMFNTISVDANKAFPYTRVVNVANGSLGKIDTLTNYKYNICCENSLESGYTTEKCFEALAAGCIPIYYGDDPVEPRVLHQYNILYVDRLTYLDHSIKFNPDRVWRDDALLHIYTTYLKIWCIVKNKLGCKEIKPEFTVNYNCNDKDEAVVIFAQHWLKYNNFHTPRARVCVSNNILWMENVADELYEKYHL
jgi:alpha(1,3/1,4) fucosyltransferase